MNLNAGGNYGWGLHDVRFAATYRFVLEFKMTCHAMPIAPLSWKFFPRVRMFRNIDGRVNSEVLFEKDLDAYFFL